METGVWRGMMHKAMRLTYKVLMCQVCFDVYSSLGVDFLTISQSSSSVMPVFTSNSII